MTKVFDAKHSIESFKALVLEMMKGYRFDVEGLYLKGGTVRPLPSEASVVGKVVEITIHEHLSRKLLQERQLKSIPASSDRVYPDVSFNGPMIFPNKFALDVKCACREKVPPDFQRFAGRNRGTSQPSTEQSAFPALSVGSVWSNRT